MPIAHAHEGATAGRRACPTCGSGAVELFRCGQFGVLARCGGCTLVFRSSPIREMIDRPYSERQRRRLEQARRPLYPIALRSFRAFGNPGRILDAGCGDGAFALLAKEHGWEVVALELSEHDARAARQRGAFPVLRATVESVPLKANAFDIVTLWDVLDHAQDPGATLREAWRVLRPGGLVYLRVRNGPTHLFLQRLPLVPANASVLHNCAFGRRSLATAMELAGFSEILIDASPLTSGDPYLSVTKRLRPLLRGLKTGWGVAARLIARLTGRRWLLGPSIQATARRPSS